MEEILKKNQEHIQKEDLKHIKLENSKTKKENLELKQEQLR